MIDEQLTNNKEPEFGPYVSIDHDKSTLTIKFQQGPIREVGENGAQIDVLFEVGRSIIDHFNQMVPCRENAMVIIKIDEALLWLGKRRADREKRGSEGTYAL